MNTVTCDRCGEEVTPRVSAYSGAEYVEITRETMLPDAQTARKIDLCTDCHRKINKIIADFLNEN